jgi:acyl-coenzyme A thioesterase PaaI-like protein
MSPDEQQKRVRASFAKQGLMTTLGATLDSVSPGVVEIIVSPHPAILQQHGFVHGGVVSAIADSAAGYAALSLMPVDTGFSLQSSRSTFLLPQQVSTSLPVDAL